MKYAVESESGVNTVLEPCVVLLDPNCIVGLAVTSWFVAPIKIVFCPSVIFR